MGKLRKVVQKLNFLWGSLAVLGVLTVTLYGINIPRDLDIYSKQGWFVLRPYKYGVYLTQPNTGVFYNFSPYDAYFQKGTETPEKLLKIGEGTELISRESQLLRDTLNRPVAAVYAVLSYFSMVDPSATFNAAGKKMVLSGRFEGNTAILQINRNELNLRNERELYLALSYNEEDFLLNENGSTLIQREPQDIDEINKIYGKALITPSPAQGRNSTEGVNKVIIFNKALNGAIAVDALSDSFEFSFIDTANKLIYFRSKTPDTPLLKVQLYDSFPEALGI